MVEAIKRAKEYEEEKIIDTTVSPKDLKERRIYSI
jgi:hypothetical protein